MIKSTLLIALVTLANIALAHPTVSAKEAKKFVGSKVSICGKVSGSKGPISNAAKNTVVQLLDAANDASINVIIRQENRKNFTYKPEEFLYNKNVCITGIIAENHGTAELIIQRQNEIKIEESGGGSDIRPFDFDGFNRFMQEDD